MEVSPLDTLGFIYLSCLEHIMPEWESLNFAYGWSSLEISQLPVSDQDLGLPIPFNF